jgi:hypothetical protein
MFIWTCIKELARAFTRRRRGAPGQLEFEARAGSGGVSAQREVTAVGLRDFSGDRQAEAGAAAVGSLAGAAVERHLEQVLGPSAQAPGGARAPRVRVKDEAILMLD